MRWQDIDTENATLSLPVTKSGKPHIVALSPLALEIIESLPRIGDSPLVFPASRAGSSNPVSGFSKAKTRLDALSGVKGWRIHDIRRSVATGLQRLGVGLEVTESVLGHQSGSRSGIVGVYQRHEYRDEARDALNRWGRELERIIGREVAKVVALR
jgi:integrase